MQATESAANNNKNNTKTLSINKHLGAEYTTKSVILVVAFVQSIYAHKLYFIIISISIINNTR